MITLNNKIKNINLKKKLLKTVDFDFDDYSISGVLYELTTGQYEVFFSQTNINSVQDLYYETFDLLEKAETKYEDLYNKYKKENS